MTPKPLIMGILNLTPDSFSDGGQFMQLDSALAHVETMVDEGVDIIDIGGESTRPGAAPITAEEECDRTLPVISAIRQRFPVTLSIDTYKATVAERALEAGATIVNDISAGRDPRMASVVAASDARVVLMHMLESPITMQRSPTYTDGVVATVKGFLRDRAAEFVAAGVPANRIWVDPGIGFGKKLEHNLSLLAHLGELVPSGSSLAIGTSRKSFLSAILDNPSMECRFEGTIASNLWALEAGATLFRVHDVGAVNRAVKTWLAIQNAK